MPWIDIGPWIEGQPDHECETEKDIGRGMVIDVFAHFALHATRGNIVEYMIEAATL